MITFLKLSLSAVETVPEVINNYTFIKELEPKHQAGRLFSDSGTCFLPLSKKIKKLFHRIQSQRKSLSAWQDDEGVCIKVPLVLSC